MEVGGVLEQWCAHLPYMLGESVVQERLYSTLKRTRYFIASHCVLVFPGVQTVLMLPVEMERAYGKEEVTSPSCSAFFFHLFCVKDLPTGSRFWLELIEETIECKAKPTGPRFWLDLIEGTTERLHNYRASFKKNLQCKRKQILDSFLLRARGDSK